MIKKVLSVFLAGQLALLAEAPLQSQQAPPVSGTPGQAGSGQQTTPSVAAPMVQSLNIIVLEGEGASNSIERHTGIAPVVEVRDENQRPVEGASVTFRCPAAGPSGHFAGGALAKTFLTNLQGQATATGLVPNDEPGRFQIHVTATIGARMGQAIVSEINTPNELVRLPSEIKRKSRWWIWVAAGAAAAAAAGIIVATRGGSKTAASTPPVITINPVSVTVGQ